MWGVALSYSAVGLELAIGIVGGYLLGHWLDGRYGTTPYLMLTMLLLGTFAGFLSLYRTAMRINRDLEADEDGEEKPAEEKPAEEEDRD